MRQFQKFSDFAPIGAEKPVQQHTSHHNSSPLLAGGGGLAPCAPKVLLMLCFLLFIHLKTLNAQESVQCTFPAPNTPTLCQRFASINFLCTSAPITTSQLPTGWFNEQKCLNNTLLVNSFFEISNCIIKMGPNAKIVVTSGGNLDCHDTKIFGCGEDNGSWIGIEMIGTGFLDFRRNHVEDATIAINIIEKTTGLYVGDNLFNRNNVDISASGISVNAIVVGNTFDCTSNTYTGDRSSVGINLSGASMTIGLSQLGQSGSKNIFNRHKIAIKAVGGSIARIGYCDFNCNITHGILGLASTIYVNELGTNLGFYNTFRSNQQDIRSVRCNLEVIGNEFYDCRTDNIRSESNFTGEVINIIDNFIEVPLAQDPGVLKKTAIYLERSTGADAINNIERNGINIADFGTGIARSAIRIVGSAGQTGKLDVRLNTINAGSGGNPPIALNNTNLWTTLIDYEVGPTSNAEFYVNTVNLTNVNSPNFGFRWGFYLHDWDSPGGAGLTNLLQGNNIFGQADPGFDYGCCAMHWEDAGPWYIYSNETGNTLRGFHLTGMCGVSEFLSNDMYDHKSPSNNLSTTAALILDGAGTFIGPQLCRNNRWHKPNYSINHGALFQQYAQGDLLLNQFTYDGNEPLQKPNPVFPSFPANAWFSPEPGGCPENTDGPNTAIELDLLERQIIKRNLSYWPTEKVEEWEARVSVLGKLLHYPELKEGDLDVNTFFNTHISTSAGLFAQWAENLHLSKSISTEQLVASAQNALTIAQVKQDLEVLDQALSGGNQPSVDFFSVRAEVLAQLDQLMIDRTTLQDQIVAQLQSGLTSLESSISELPGEYVFEANQKVINRLKAKKSRGEDYTTEDYDALRVIARQCPELAGKGRSWAVHQLPSGDPDARISDGPFQGDCEGLYEGMADRAAHSDLGTGISVFPNPATDQVLIGFEEAFSGTIRVTDLLGKVVVEATTLTSEQRINLPIRHLLPGHYLIRTETNLGLKHLVRIAVIR